MLRRLLAGGSLLGLALLVASCGARAVGYGVVLWGEAAGSPGTGAVVAIVQESAINSSYLISVPGERGLREYLIGRIRRFPRRSQAAAFAASYALNLQSWAVVVKEDAPPLPVRESASPDAKVVYKLQYRQLVKVISVPK